MSMEKEQGSTTPIIEYLRQQHPDKNTQTIQKNVAKDSQYPYLFTVSIIWSLAMLATGYIIGEKYFKPQDNYLVRAVRDNPRTEVAEVIPVKYIDLQIMGVAPEHVSDEPVRQGLVTTDESGQALVSVERGTTRLSLSLDLGKTLEYGDGHSICAGETTVEHENDETTRHTQILTLWLYDC